MAVVLIKRIFGKEEAQQKQDQLEAAPSVQKLAHQYQKDRKQFADIVFQLGAALEANEQTIRGLQSEVSALRVADASKETQIALIAKQKDQQHMQLAELNSRVRSVQKDNQALRDQNQRETATRKQLRHQNLELTRKLDIARRRVELEKSLNQLQKDLAEIQEAEEANPVSGAGGAAAGAMWGSWFGPIGTLVGGIFGGVAGASAPGIDAAQKHKEGKKQLLQEIERTKKALRFL